jgi:hypothetical protein
VPTAKAMGGPWAQQMPAFPCIDSLPPPATVPPGDIEELNLSNEKVRLVSAEDTAPEGEAHAAKRARAASGKDDGPHGHGAIGMAGAEAAAGANGDSVSPNGGERFVVRFVNPHAGARPDGGLSLIHI